VCSDPGLQEIGEIPALRGGELLAETQYELHLLAGEQARVMVQESYSQAFLAAVRTLLETHQAYLAEVLPGQAPPALDSVMAPSTFPPGARAVGWRLEGEVWLRPDVAWAEISPWFIRQGRVPPGHAGTYEQLDAMRAIARRTEPERTYVTRIGGRAVRVLALDARAIDEE